MSSKEIKVYSLRLGKYWLATPIKGDGLDLSLRMTDDINSALRATAPVAKRLISELGCIPYLISTKPVANSLVEQYFESNYKGDSHDDH